jgi:UDP-N-acetylmuramate-alanine ligase
MRKTSRFLETVMKTTSILALAIAGAFMVGVAGDAEAAKKKIRGSDLSKAQRQQFMKDAQRACKSRYGTNVYEIDWYRMKIWCQWT